jgi:magnesium-transporting ATPase (P-type)
MAVIKLARSERGRGALIFIVDKIKWIMLVAGALTCTMLYAAIAPQAALQSNFGEPLSGPIADIVVRNWGVLIALIGAMLIYGAYHPPVRMLVLTVAGLSKLVFAALVLSHGARFLGYQAGIAVAVDLIWVAVFAAYLFCAPRRPA